MGIRAFDVVPPGRGHRKTAWTPGGSPEDQDVPIDSDYSLEDAGMYENPPSRSPEDDLLKDPYIYSKLQERESDILRAMAVASLGEQRRLATELEGLRGLRREARAQERDTDLSSAVIRDHLTPVLTHSHHTAATDWVDDAVPVAPSDSQLQQEMLTQASLWFDRVSPEVKSDPHEFKEQARGMAGYLASAYGPASGQGRRIFIDHVAHLYRVAQDDDWPLDDEETEENPNVAPWTEQQTTGDTQDWGEIPSGVHGRRRIAEKDDDSDDSDSDDDRNTCAICGAPIERDPAHEDPQTWHHDDGEKHDHEAKPKNEGKESKIAKTVYEIIDEDGDVVDEVDTYEEANEYRNNHNDQFGGGWDIRRKEAQRKIAGDPPLGSQYEYDYRLGKEDAKAGRPRDPQGGAGYKQGYDSVKKESHLYVYADDKPGIVQCSCCGKHISQKMAVVI